MANELYDLIITGVGPAGQSAALIAGRTRTKSALINAEAPRNFVTTASHGFLTRDGVHPSELMAVAKEQLKTYPTVRYIADSIADVARLPAGFSATTATGAPMMCIWSQDMIVFTNDKPLDGKLKAELGARGVPVEEGKVARLRSVNGRLTHVPLQGGRELTRQSGFVVEEFSSPATDFTEPLGVIPNKENDWGMAELAGASGTTNIPGLYVVGDAWIGFSGVATTVSEDGFCVEMMANEVAMERWNALSEGIK